METYLYFTARNLRTGIITVVLTVMTLTYAHPERHILKGGLKNTITEKGDTTLITSLLRSAERNIKKPGEMLLDMDSAGWFLSQAEPLCTTPDLYLLRLRCRYFRGLICLEKRQWDEARKIMLPLADDYKKIGEVSSQANALDSYGSYLPGWKELKEEKIEMLTQAAKLYNISKETNKEFRVLRLVIKVEFIASVPFRKSPEKFIITQTA